MRAFNTREKNIIRKLVTLRDEYNKSMPDFLTSYVYDRSNNAALFIDFGQDDELYLFEPINPDFDEKIDHPNEEAERFYELMSLIVYLKDERFISLYSLMGDPAPDKGGRLHIGECMAKEGDRDATDSYKIIYCDHPRFPELCDAEGKRTHTTIALGGLCRKLVLENFVTRIYISEDLKELVKDNFMSREEKRFRKNYRLTWAALIVAISIGVAGIVIQCIT